MIRKATTNKVGKAAGSFDQEEEPDGEMQAFNLCSVYALAPDHHYENEWIRITLDTGTATTAFPEDVTYGKEITVKEGAQRPPFRTVTGERIEAETRQCVHGGGNGDKTFDSKAGALLLISRCSQPEK